MKAFSPSGILITGGNSLESDKEEDVLKKEFNFKVIDFAIKEKNTIAWSVLWNANN